jgi:hypothetical protein
MEAVGATASIISIATLAIQLGDALRKAAEFWDAIEDAPANVQRISRELQLLVKGLDTIRHQHEATLDSDEHEQWIRQALELVKEDIDELVDLVSDLSRSLGPGYGRVKQNWGKVRIVLKRDKIRRCKHNIESAKTMLSLLQTSQTR